MNFWDASAIVPLCCRQPATPSVQAFIKQAPGMVVWWSTVVEVSSALERLSRAAQIDVLGYQSAMRRLQRLSAAWVEVQPTGALRAEGLRLLTVHPLRAADALQLAAGRIWAGSIPTGQAFVCLDQRLRDAALYEGFDVLP